MVSKCWTRGFERLGWWWWVHHYYVSSCYILYMWLGLVVVCEATVTLQRCRFFDVCIRQKTKVNNISKSVSALNIYHIFQHNNKLTLHGIGIHSLTPQIIQFSTNIFCKSSYTYLQSSTDAIVYFVYLFVHIVTSETEIQNT